MKFAYLCKFIFGCKYTLIKRTGHILITTWLAILLLVGTTPKEYIHLFAAHTDTVHTHVEKDGLVIETEHHHCSFLDDALPLFINDFVGVKLFHSPAVFFVHNSPVLHQQYSITTVTACLRGPPIA